MTNREKCDLVAKFNQFIKKWCGDSHPHLIDTDENDGEKFRQSLLKLIDENEKLKDELLRQLKNKEDLQEKLKVARWALNKLSRLGNEPNLGNSTGNMIAREALQRIGEV